MSQLLSKSELLAPLPPKYLPSPSTALNDESSSGVSKLDRVTDFLLTIPSASSSTGGATGLTRGTIEQKLNNRVVRVVGGSERGGGKKVLSRKGNLRKKLSKTKKRKLGEGATTATTTRTTTTTTATTTATTTIAATPTAALKTTTTTSTNRRNHKNHKRSRKSPRRKASSSPSSSSNHFSGSLTVSETSLLAAEWNSYFARWVGAADKSEERTLRGFVLGGGGQGFIEKKGKTRDKGGCTLTGAEVSLVSSMEKFVVIQETATAFIVVSRDGGVAKKWKKVDGAIELAVAGHDSVVVTA